MSIEATLTCPKNTKIVGQAAHAVRVATKPNTLLIFGVENAVIASRLMPKSVAGQESRISW